ncbi:MAG: DUF4428 domain-containing protein [Clostridia bacterium]|nr:DUF4428 domain-containing protein [Clostridia bacterium]
MGLFDKKYCDVCGDKIGLLGNRKLEDGNLCKNCAKKLSPFFSERRSSTVAQIKEQLAYREQNQRELANLNPTVTYGRGRKIFVDTAAKKFVCTYMTDWKSDNPDIISFSQVKDVKLNIEEHKSEIYTKDAEGKRISYKPPRYEYEYEFEITIFVDSPYFSEIEMELSSSNRPDSPYTDLYREYERQADELIRTLKGMPAQTASAAAGQSTGTGMAQTIPCAANDVLYRYMDSDGIDLTLKINVALKFDVQIIDENIYRYMVLEDTTKIQSAMKMAVQTVILETKMPGVEPDQLPAHSIEIMSALMAKCKDFPSIYGVAVTSISIQRIIMDPESNKMMMQVKQLKQRKDAMNGGAPGAAPVQAAAAPAASGPWDCPICGGTGNTGKFCEYCGEKRPG